MFITTCMLWLSVSNLNDSLVTFCMLSLISEVLMDPLANLILSRLATDSSPALGLSAESFSPVETNKQNKTLSWHNVLKNSTTLQLKKLHCSVKVITLFRITNISLLLSEYNNTFFYMMSSPGLCTSAMVRAQALPNTTRSSKELAPSRLAPCTLAHAASPQA